MKPTRVIIPILTYYKSPTSYLLQNPQELYPFLPTTKPRSLLQKQLYHLYWKFKKIYHLVEVQEGFYSYTVFNWKYLLFKRMTEEWFKGD